MKLSSHNFAVFSQVISELISIFFYEYQVTQLQRKMEYEIDSSIAKNN